MRALLYKDFIAVRKPMALMALILTVIGFYFYKEGQIALFPLVFILLPVILLGMLFGADVPSKFDHYIIASPLRRSTVVLSRYLLLWILAISGALLAVLIFAFDKNSPFRLAWYLVAPSMLLLASFIAAIELPLMYRFGEAQARIIFVGLYFLTFALFSSVASNKEWIIEKLRAGFAMDGRLLGLLIAVLTIAINALSFSFARSIYEKKEV